MLRYPSVQLFVRRVAARAGSVVLTDEEAPFVAEEALTLVADALDVQKRGGGGNFWFAPALMRVKGLILASRSHEDYPEAETSFLSAIDLGETPIRHPF